MFVDTFIRRPILASVCSLVLILAGAVAIPTMPVAQYPSLASPQVNVTAIYTGANAQEVETAVTTPLEQAINGVEGMLYMTSSSTNSGISTVTVTFDVTRDQDVAAVDVQNRVNQTLGRMPAEVRTTGITVQKQSTGFIMAVGVFSEKGDYDSLFLSNYLDVYIKDAVKRVPGVGDVVVFGERKYSMRLWIDPDRLAARGLTANDVVQALREQNVQVAAGSLGQAPAPAGQMYQLSVRALGRLTEASEFENIILKSGRDGSLVRLKDVGRAELGAETYAANLRFQGVEAVGFGVTQLPTANSLDVERAVTAELDRLAAAFPPGMRYLVSFNTTDVVEASIAEVLKTLVEAIILVVLVIFVFLQTWRSTLIPAITIPVSLIGAFAFVKLMGFSINTLTLFGIILATGIVVDDAIVVIENIERHIQEYKVTARKAASDAMREVLGAVVATGLVLIAVFVPVAFFPGTTGRLYAQFSITIAFAVALSVFNAVTLTPALSALLLDRTSHHKSRFFALFERIVDTGTRFYVAVLRSCLRWRWAVVLLFVGTLGLDVVGLSHRAAGVHPRRGPRLLPHPGAGAGGSIARIHRGDRAAGGRHHPQGSRCDGALLGHGVQLQRRGVEPGPDVRPPQALRGSDRRRAFGAGGARAHQRTALRDSRRDRRRVHAAGDPGTEPVRRLRIPGPRSERRRDHAPRAGDAGDCRGRQPVAEAATGPVQPVHGE